MLQLSGTIPRRHVLSLRTNSPIAEVTAPLINPDNLKIVGFYCNDYSSKDQKILLYQDIRDVLPQGLIVNDYDALSDPTELIRLKEIIEREFVLLGKLVETISHEKVGKVGDFAYETTTMYVQKLYVVQSIFKSLTNGNLSVDRNQVNEVTRTKIIINDLLQTAPVSASPVSA